MNLDKPSKRARELRSNSTDAERKLWSLLRNRQLGGYKFKRQVPIGPYIADFCCIEKRLIVELDGGHHQDQEARDQVRTNLIHMNRYTVLRFWNNDVLSNIHGVCDQILKSLDDPHLTSPHYDGERDSETNTSPNNSRERSTRRVG